MHRPRLISMRPWTALIAAACIFAQLALATAAFWHHHHDGDARHDDCAVCVAASSDRTDGLPPTLFALLPLQHVGFIEFSIEAHASGLWLGVPFARGPPTA